MFRTNVTNLAPKLLKMAILDTDNDPIEFPMGQKLGKVSRMFRMQVTNFAILAYFSAKMATNGHFGHSG